MRTYRMVVGVRLLALVCTLALAIPLHNRSVYAQQNGSLQFDGAADYARMSDLPLLTQFTAEAWVRRSADTGTYETILSDANSGYSQATLTLYIDGGSQDCGAPDQFAFYQHSGNVVLCSGVTATIGAWFHIAATRDASGTLRLFVNGALRATRTASPTPNNSSAPLSLGRAGDYNGEYFAGLINTVRITDNALYSADFTPPATFDALPGAVALYLLDEGSGQTLADSSGNGRNGALGATTAVEAADPAWSPETPQGSAPAGTPTNTPLPTQTGTPTGTPTPTQAGQPTSTSTATRTPTATGIPAPTSTPSSTEAQLGRWEAPFSFPVPAVHAMFQPNGEILFWDEINGGLGAYLWTPGSTFFTPVPNTQTNLFCVGQSSLPDGRLFAVGGHLNQNYYGLRDSNIFDPATRTWTRTANMTYARWYPTITQLPDGRMLAVSGYITPGQLATIPEVYNPATNTWTALNGANLSVPMYSFMFVLPDGRVFNAGPSTTTRILDVNAQSWTTVGNSLITGHSAVMYTPGRVMKSGAYGDPDNPVANAHGRTVIIDMNQQSPAWRETAAMAFPRAYHTLTMLPDGTVLATGGERTGSGQNTSAAVYAAEIWDPVTERWTTMASHQRPRMYHSTAMLLPDGRVLSAGGEFPPYYESNAEIYSPPYLFRGPRPTITGAPASAAFGSSFFVGTPDAAQIATVSLIRIPAVTHGIDMSQRYVPLNFTQASGGLNIAAPSGPSIAPPGMYMLFLVNSNGVPSIASIMQITTSASGTPTITATSTPTRTATNTPTRTATGTPTGTATSTATGAPATSTPTGAPATSTATNTPTSTSTSTATPITGSFALRFDGTNDIARGAAPAGTPRTIEAWVRPGAANESGVIVAQASETRGWSLELVNGRAVFWMADSNGTWRRAINNTTLVSGQWYHIAATYSSTTARIYVGGVRGGAANVGTLAAGPDLRLGGAPGAPFFNGQIDEVRISSIVRYTAATVTPPGRFTNDSSTQALYHFDEGSGQISVSDTSAGNTLTLGSGAETDNADPTWVASTAPGN
jgi:hypothetical protein